MKKYIPITNKNVVLYIGLTTHILTMSNDAYLANHPEWHELVKEAESALKAENINFGK